MKSNGYLASALATLLSISACDSGTPSGPSRVPPSGAVSVGVSQVGTNIASGDIGRIRITEVGSGATLTVKDCSSRRLKAMCTDQLRLALEVMVRRDMADAAVTVGFFDGAFECGTASISPLALSAGMPVSLKTRAVFTESEIDEGEGSPKTQVGQQCRLPATTHRMVVKLWRHGDSRNPVLTQDFAHTFKFVMP